jgi:hypothetical protein
VGFVADKSEMGQLFSEYFGFPCQAFHRLLNIHHHHHHHHHHTELINRPVVGSPPLNPKKETRRLEGTGFFSACNGN